MLVTHDFSMDQSTQRKEIVNTHHVTEVSSGHQSYVPSSELCTALLSIPKGHEHDLRSI